MEDLFNNIYILSFYGFLIYTIGKFNIEKDEFDNEDKNFSLSKYFKKNWDNWLFSLILVPILAFKAEVMWASFVNILGKEWGFYQIYYLCVGALVEAFYTAYAWFKNKRKPK